MGDNNCIPIKGRGVCQSFYPAGTEPDEGALKCQDVMLSLNNEEVSGKVCTYPFSEALPGPLKYMPEFITASYMKLFSADVDEDEVAGEDATDPDPMPSDPAFSLPAPAAGVAAPVLGMEISAHFGIKVPVTETDGKKVVLQRDVIGALEQSSFRTVVLAISNLPPQAQSLVLKAITALANQKLQANPGKAEIMLSREEITERMDVILNTLSQPSDAEMAPPREAAAGQGQPGSAAETAGTADKPRTGQTTQQGAQGSGHSGGKKKVKKPKAQEKKPLVKW